MDAARALSTHWLSGWPELVAEWHPTRNLGLDPDEVSHGSGRKIWWKCPNGPDHEWRASANNRTSGRTGCPCCAGRMVSVTNNLATLRPELAKQWHLTLNGELVPEQVVAGSTRRVWWKCPVAPDHQWRVSPHDRWSVDGECPFCLRHRVCRSNSLAETRPRLAAEWHPKKNHGLTARDVVEGSARRVWWRCARHTEHEWCASVSNRTLRRSGCPFCLGRRASPQHCLELSYPAIAREWHPTRNGVLTPTTVTPRAARTAWWLCAKGHEWRSIVSTRTRRLSLCPTCSATTPVRGRVSSTGRDSGGATHARRDLIEEHRRLEQVMVLLAADPDVGDGMLSRFAVDLTAHLDGDATVLYPALEHELNHPLVSPREVLTRLRRLLAAIPGDPPFRSDRLRELHAAFQEHCRFEEGVALPALESAMAPRSLDALWRRVRAVRTAVLVRCAHGARGLITKP